MNIAPQPSEKQISIDDDKPFVSKQDVGAADANTPAYTIEGPDSYLIAVDQNTPVAPEFRDSNGDELDGSTRITIQKCDKQGNPIGSGVVFSDVLSRFEYNQMRSDPDFFRRTQKALMVDEYEIVKVFVDIPSGSNGFDASQSRLTIGDDTSDFGKPVGIMSKGDLSPQQGKAVKQASQSAGGQ